MSSHKQYLLCLVLCMGLISCSHQQSVLQVEHPQIEDDKEYSQALKSVYRSSVLYTNFSTKYMLGVTAITESFYSQLKQRHIRLVNNDSATILAESKEQLCFFITTYTPNPNDSRLIDPLLWGVSLKVNQEQNLTASRKNLKSQKSHTSPYFPSVNNWTRDYLVCFDIDPNSINISSNLTTMELILTNRDGQATFVW